MEETIRQALAAAVGESGSPGAVAYVGNLDAPIFFEALGHAQLEPVPAPAQTSTIYDLASLTKVVATTTALL
ncbi:MAG TPA: serine hydrolase, partial [Candidatus Hydrogenedentes bacterium]|nr:serine hydrolase [Candidatus Hydrogenedentota bacterium]